MRPYISEELLTLGKISMGIPKYLMGIRGSSLWIIKPIVVSAFFNSVALKSVKMRLCTHKKAQLVLFYFGSHHMTQRSMLIYEKKQICINDCGMNFKVKRDIFQIKSSMMDSKNNERQLSYLHSSGSQSIVWILNSMVLLALVTSVQWTPPDLPPVKHCWTAIRNTHTKSVFVSQLHDIYTSVEAGSLYLPKWARSPRCRTWRGETRRLRGPRSRCPSASEVSLRWSKCWSGAPSYAAGWQRHEQPYIKSPHLQINIKYSI